MMYASLSTEFYDADKNFATSEEINFYKSLFKKADLILEPMCGSGRFLIPFVQEGYTVHGLDNSPHMLKNCKERAFKLGLSLGSVDIYTLDKCKCQQSLALFESSLENFQSAIQYDGIIIPLGSFQLLYPRTIALQILEKFKMLLKPGGKLVMDLFVPWDALYENNQDIKSSREITINDNTVIKVDQNSSANKEEQWFFSTSVYTKFINQEVVKTETEHIYLLWFYRYEMELILEKYGFKNIQCYDRYLNHEDLMTFVSEN